MDLAWHFLSLVRTTVYGSLPLALHCICVRSADASLCDGNWDKLQRWRVEGGERKNNILKALPN